MQRSLRTVYADMLRLTLTLFFFVATFRVGYVCNVQHKIKTCFRNIFEGKFLENLGETIEKLQNDFFKILKKLRHNFENFRGIRNNYLDDCRH